MHTQPVNIQVETKDGFLLEATVVHAPSQRKATVIVHPATGAPARYYAAYAAYLAKHGYTAITYDYRGIGRSRPRDLRNFAASMTAWATIDAHAMTEYARGLAQGGHVYMIGHSFGGQLLGLDDTAGDVDAVMLVASQLGYVGHWEGFAKWRVGFAMHVLFPTLTARYGYLPGSFGLNEDLPKGVADEWSRWCTHPDYLLGFHPEARQRFARMTQRTLMYSFTDDAFAPPRAVQSLRNALSNAKREERTIAPSQLGVRSIGHFGFFRPRFEHSLWRDSIKFFEVVQRGEPMPSMQAFESSWGISSDDILADLHFGRADDTIARH